MDRRATAARLATVAGSAARVEAAGPPPRAAAAVAGIPVVDLGVGTPWSVRAFVPAGVLPGDDALGAAMAWCRERGGARGFRVNVRADEEPVLAGFGLVRCDSLAVYAMPASAAPDVHRSTVAGLEIRKTTDRDELVAAYGGWMADLPLADSLISPLDMTNRARRMLIGSVSGTPVGCALVAFAQGTAYLSGIGVVAAARRRGYGGALTAAAVELGTRTRVDGATDLVWMHATGSGAGLYAAMGFQRVDVHHQLGPA